MKVLILTNLYPTESAPLFGTFVREQVEALRKLGIDLDVQFVNGSVSKANYVRGLFEFWGRIRRQRYDIIHAHYVYSGWIARMQLGIPILVTSHGSDTLGFEGKLLRMLYPLVGGVTITSKQNQARVGLPDSHLLPCGVDTDLFFPTDTREAKMKLGWDPDRKVMITLGRDAPLKRLDIIRAAHEIVRSQMPNVDLVLATKVAHQDVPGLLNASDVFAFASETEGSPVAVKEALACNLPIVSVDVGDVIELIGDTESCFICERTPESVAEYVLQVLKAGRRSNGWETVQKYSNRATAERLVGIYEQIISKSRKSRSR